MSQTFVYRIAKWADVFETSESRKLKKLHWCALPINFLSSGYQSLLDEFGDDAPSIYGAWCALVGIAASQNTRGTLADSKGNPLAVSLYVRTTGFPESVFVRLIEWASSVNVRWLETVPVGSFPLGESYPDEKPNENTRETKSARVPADSPDDLPDGREKNTPTEQNRTRHNTTEQHTTEQDTRRTVDAVGSSGGVVGGGVGLVCSDGVGVGGFWKTVDKTFWEHVVDVAGGLGRAKRLTREPGVDRQWIWSVACVSVRFDRGVADDSANKLKSSSSEIRKPKAYIEGVMRKLCERHGENWDRLRMTVPPVPPPRNAGPVEVVPEEELCSTTD